jgi:hypothetical protein
VAELLDDLIQIAPRYGSRNALIGYVDEWLRRRVPLLALRVNAASHRSPRIDGMLSFGLRDTGRSGAPRAHVEFRPACALDESQVRLLEAGACVLSVLLATR